FGWREIRNGRELGALVGLAPALYQSGATQHDRGITRAGNAHVRRMMVQLAWGWLRWQPDSVLAQWYHRPCRTRSARPSSRQPGRSEMPARCGRRRHAEAWRHQDAERRGCPPP
ncbi:MAG: transposase, partial [Luteitalea sp.]|nr:transposase [Luteitalea sp.]